MTRPRWALVGLAAAAALTASALPLPSTGAGELPPGPAMGPGATFWVSGSESPTPYDPAASRPAVSADGSRVAFDVSSSFGEGDGGTIEVRRTDGAQGQVVTAGRSSTAPSLSGDGERVAFVSGREGAVADGSDAADVYLGDLSGPQPVTRRVTDLPGDLGYQRVDACRSALTPGEDDVSATSRCGPVLSDDGGTLAFQARLSVVSPDLDQAVDDEGPATYLDAGRGLALVDFSDDTVSRVVTLRALGARPVVLTGVGVVSGGRWFSARTPGEATSCDGVRLAPFGGTSCQVELVVDRGTGCRTDVGTLRLTGPTPRSRTAVRLVAEETGGCPWQAGGEGSTRARTRALPQARVDACAAHRLPEDLPAPSERTEARLVTRSLGEQAVGVPALLAQPVDGDGGTGGDTRVTLEGGGCAFRLVQPELGPSPPPGDEPCRPGQVLIYYDSCTAYVSFRPGAVGTHVASLVLSDYSTGEPLTRFRLVGAGERDVVVVRRDPGHSGRFTGPGRPAARVVSVDQAGELVDGVSPSLSADGRHVAFSSTRDGRYAGTQVLVHDTDARGDRTFRGGGTVLVSRLRAGPDGLPYAASGPSLSGDGTRVAFITVHRFSAGTIPYVRVRDLPLGRTVVASAARDGTFADAASFAPSLSRDGGAVAYVSYATNLLDTGKDCCSTDVYVRELAADFGEVEPAEGSPNDIVSLPADGTEPGQHLSGAPAVNRDGSLVAFVSSAALVPDAVVFSPQVYARARFAVPVVSPGSIDFPVQQVDTVGPAATVRVGNLGPGPAVLRTALRGPFRLTDACDGATLHRGETCVIKVAFAPTSTGELVGAVVVRSETFAWTGDVQVVGLAGASIPLLLTVEPGALDFPETGIGLASEPITVTATNLGSLPMALAATVTAGDESFAVDPDPETCSELAPGASCELETRFLPAGLGDLAGSLRVVGTVAGLPYPQDVPATGTTAEPSVEFSPEVTREGRVVFVSGEHFLPGVPVQLTWDTGQVAAPVIVPDDEGAFSAPVVILTGRGPGTRQLTVSMPGVADSDVEAPPLLVVLGSAQPPDFVTRN